MALPGMDLPVRQAAEWPGAVSGKFTDSFTALPMVRKIVKTDCRDGGPVGLARNGFGQYFTDVNGLAIQQGKRMVPQAPSEVHTWKPAKRCLAEPGMYHLEKPEGRARVEQAPGKVYTMPERRHVRQVESKQEHGDLPQSKGIIHRGNGLRAHDQPATEVDISAEMSRKARTLDLEGQRNGIDCRSLGDKAYRHPEYASKFFHPGELAVGSSWHRGMHKKTEARGSVTVKLIERQGKPGKSYREKQMDLMMSEAQSEVADLTRNWETGTLKECDEGYLEPIDSDEEVEAMPSTS
eukprot:TRINITY_DN2984_c0_g1_i1.p1 TRINITY_DN2984_c0_g1~~TRINITY_DN2984_c0_g1_i1.p1  ORF type:complete len:294 (-),score=67.17 TRINITY_DN2984_c0_g1_i1:128-1009(-)